MNSKKFSEQLGKKIKLLRKRANLTQEFFSEQIGIEPQNLSRIERGLNSPSLATFVRVCEVLDITPNDLLDVEYIVDEKTLDLKISELLAKQSVMEKQLTYRIMKIISG